MNRSFRITFFYFLLVAFNASAQSLDEQIKILKENVNTVKGKKTEFKQEFNQRDEIPFIVSITITELNSGEETIQSVNVRDVNPSRVVFKPKRDLIEVSAQVKGGKKLVKVIKDATLENYRNEVLFYASGIEEARSITDALKAVAEIADDFEDPGEKNRSKQELLSYFNGAIGDVVINENTFKQTLTFNKQNPNVISFKTEDISKGTVERYTINAADINLHKIDFQTRRNEVFVDLVTKADRKLIAYTKDGLIGNYVNRFEMKMNSIEDARKLAKRFKTFTELSEKEETTDFANFNYQQCIDFLTANVGEVVINQDAYKQAFSSDPDNNLIFTIKYRDVSKGEENQFTLNAADLHKGRTSFDTKGNAVFVNLRTGNKYKLIKTRKNEEDANYSYSIDIRSQDVENGRSIAEVFSRFKGLAREKMDKLTSFSSVADAENYITQTVDKVVNNTDTYEQKVEKDKENSCLFSYQITDVSKDAQYDYEFNFRDIDLHKIHFDTKGPMAVLNMEVKGKKKLIKSYKDGEVSKYGYAVEIIAKDIEEARTLVSAFKKVAEACAEN